VSGRIHLALDVLSTEPLPLNSPWLGMRNVLISPHIGGPTNDRYARCGAFALENVRRYFAREPLEAVITPEIYDRIT
jgi:phosphoglycerate dehydrogenase-like enzyme